MTDLSSPQIKTMLKSNQRASILTNAVMAVIAAFTAALAIWVAVEKSRFKLTDWSVGVFIALLCVMVLLFIFVIVWEIFLRRPYRGVMHRFVAERFSDCENMLKEGENAEYEMMLAGDKLTLFRQGFEVVAQFDLAPIKAYPTVCSYCSRLVINYLSDYYRLNAQTLSITSVTVSDKVRGKEKLRVILSPEKPLKEKPNNFFIASGLIEKL